MREQNRWAWRVFRRISCLFGTMLAMRQSAQLFRCSFVDRRALWPVLERQRPVDRCGCVVRSGWAFGGVIITMTRFVHRVLRYATGAWHG